MSKATYPIYTTPTEAFLALLRERQCPTLLVSDLEFIELSKGRFGANFTVQLRGKRLKQSVSIRRGFPSLDAIEDYLLDALAPDGQFA